MLRQSLLKNINAVFFNTYRCYLSQEFKSTAKEAYNNAYVAKIANSNETVADGATKDLDIAKQFTLLRSKKLEPATLDSASYSVINYFVESGNAQDLRAIIKNRLEYGVFLTPFSACYLLDYYLKAEDLAAAAEIGVEATIQELLDNELVLALTLKAIFGQIKAFPAIENVVAKPETVKKKDEKKVRVKFIRNPVEFDMGRSKLSKKTILETLEKCAAKVQHKDIKLSCQLVAKLLTDEPMAYKDMQIKTVPEDIKMLCLEIAKGNTELEEALAELQAEKSLSLTAILEDYVNGIVEKEQVKLIAQQQKDYALWLEQHARDVEADKLEKNKEERAANIDVLLTDIQTQRQKLWFFEEEEKLDLEIYNKRPIYRKRWFGKKKKPKVIDENYVPPEIRH